MINLKKKNIGVNNLLKNSKISSKIYIYFSTKNAGDDYDPYEKRYIFTNLNPICIKGYVYDIKPEALVWKQYGIAETGAKEIICEKKYAEYFRLANRIVIDGDDYSQYKESLGNKILITERPFNLIRITVFKKV